MKKVVGILVASVFLAAGCGSRQAPVVQTEKPDTEAPVVAVRTSEVAAFLNTKLDCSSAKASIPTKECFSADLQPLPTQSVYAKPEYLFEDFTGDGAKDALVTVYYDRTGAYRDFYALTRDPAVKGNAVGPVTVAYENQSVGFSKSTPQKNAAGDYVVFCADVDKDGEPDCQLSLHWGGNFEQKYFLEQPVPSKTGIETYTSRLYPYKFTYPTKNGYVIHATNASVDHISALEDVEVYDPVSNPIDAFHVSVYPNPQKLSAVDFLKKNYDMWAESYAGLHPKSATFLKMPAVRFDPSGISPRTIITHGEYAYILVGNITAFKTFSFSE